MIKLVKLFLIISIVGMNCNAQVDKTNVEIKDGWYYINGEKFFVNALGYEIGARPGQHPKKVRDLELARMAHDLEIIKKAGFNGIRTWADLREEEVQLVQASGLKLIYGIELNQRAPDFADPEFVKESLDLVDSVLSFTHKYDCIITYLIMNEPEPQRIYDGGTQALKDLWMKAKEIIYEKHPGIPVTISGNPEILEFIDMNMFDIYSYNAYDYNNGITYTHGYTNLMRSLKELNKGNKPLIITEFGKSVSRLGYGEYGGNTLIEQRDALPEYYRNALDAGVVGLCPFYYADGWWKDGGGTPSVHNDRPEEWFGYWGYKDLQDTIGYPRPVWYAVTEYNEALIASPKNQQFYQNKVPMEFFLQDDIDRIRVIYHDGIIYEKDGLNDTYFYDELSFGNDTLLDRELVFEFYDKEGELQKCEVIIVLTGNEPIEWPSLEIETNLDDISESDSIKAKFTVKNTAAFDMAGELKYVFQHHIGWEAGQRKIANLNTERKEQELEVDYGINEKSLVVSVYASFGISYGKFEKTIYNQKFMYRGDWADPIRFK